MAAIINVGPAIRFDTTESKAGFLTRARDVLCGLKPS